MGKLTFKEKITVMARAASWNRLDEVRRLYQSMSSAERALVYFHLGSHVPGLRLETRGLLGALLLEQEDEDDTGDEGGDDLFGDEEDDVDDEGGGDDLFGDAGGDAEGGDPEADTEAALEAEREAEEQLEKEIEVSTEDELKLKDSLDAELETVMDDFEDRALKSGKIEKEFTTTESRLGGSVSRLLYEAEGDEELKTDPETLVKFFDMEQFAADVARLINNYQTLMDMEAIIYSKARRFLLDKYGKEMATKFDDMMTTRHSIDLGDELYTPPEEGPGPYAVGAFGGGGGGGAI